MFEDAAKVRYYGGAFYGLYFLMIISIYSPRSSGDSDNMEKRSASQSLSSVFDWLANAPDKNVDKELENLCAHLATLMRTDEASPVQRVKALDLLYERAQVIVTRLLPTLNVDALPVPRRIRGAARMLQTALHQLAEMHFDMLMESDVQPIKGLRCPPDVALWRIVNALANHLLASYLISARPGVGIWKQLHAAFMLARKRSVQTMKPEGEEASIQERYIQTLFLACSQPSSFGGRELRLVKVFVDHFAREARLSDIFPQAGDAGFWIDPNSDAPPAALARRPLPLGIAHLMHLSGEGAAASVRRFLAGAGNGEESTKANGEAPNGSAVITAAALAGRDTPLGNAVLQRLMTCWGGPAKRHFSRRYQNYRFSLCTGLEGVRRLLISGDALPEDLSQWMVLNESPQGYAVMHVADKPNRLRVGDIVALRAEGHFKWQVCAVRWAISENPEHLEIGVQLLASDAQAGLLAFSRQNEAPLSVPALILPQCLPLRPSETLLIAAGSAETAEGGFTLMLGKEKLQLRELHISQILERTAHIELLEIEASHFGEETLIDMSEQ